jgi:predicted ATPase
MITKVTLHNWKSFKEASLYIDPLTVLIGLNASGKSNLVDALRFLQRSVSMPLTTAITGTGGDMQISEIRGGLDWAVLNRENQFSIEITLLLSKDFKINYELSVGIGKLNGHSKKAVLLNEKAALKQTLNGQNIEGYLFQTKPIIDNEREFVKVEINRVIGEDFIIDLNRNSSVLNQIQNSIMPTYDASIRDFLIERFRNIFIFDTVPSHMRAYCSLSDTFLSDGSNAAGVIAALPEAEKTRIETLLTNYVGQLPDNPFKKIYVELVGKFGQDAMLYGTEVLPGGEEIDIDARSMSDGTLRAIALLTAILTREKGSLLVIEEVDNGLHPSKAGLLLNFMLELGKQQGVDILITTHNPALMDALEKDLLPFISVCYREEETGYSVIGLLEEFDKLPKYLAHGSLGKVISEGLINKVETPAE